MEPEPFIGINDAMKKELSFYEFVGIIVPSVTLLYFTDLILDHNSRIVLFDFSKFGDSLVFLVICYGFGQILHSFGNALETIIWKVYGGMPTNWLTKKPRFARDLFDETDSTRIKTKLFTQFSEVTNKDYGRLAYSFLFAKGLTSRIDIFNANYSLFRGLTVTFILLGFIALYFVGWQLSTLSFFIAFLSAFRMIRFAKYYAREIFRAYLVSPENS